MRTRPLAALALVVITAVPAVSGARGTKRPLERRLRAVQAMIAPNPQGLRRHLSARFLTVVPATKMKPVLRDYFKKAGAVTETRRIEAKGKHFAEYWFLTRTHVFAVKLGLDPRPPHKITTLWFGPPKRRLRSHADLLLALKKLPGKVSLAVWRLGGDKPRPVLQLNPDLPLAIGSTFKLYILGALIDRIAAGELRWEQTLRVREAWRSYPSGQLQRWPAGAPVSLASLAGQMISISDNTATDHLLFHLGRARVEAQQARMGHSRPTLNRPMLSTREMFMLKRTPGAEARIKRYLARKPHDRRTHLERTIARLPRWTFLGLDRRRPTAIDKLEWFASAADLCRALDWLRRRTENKATRLGRELLAINQGLRWSDARVRYAGFKGGSEPGVINLSWLVRRKTGGWYAVSAGWNDPGKVLETKRFDALMRSLILLLEGARSGRTG